MIPFKETSDGVLFRIKVLPRSSRCEAAGLHGEALKIKITAPPVEGKANEEVLRFVSDALGVKPAQVSIVSGRHAHLKTLAIAGINGDRLQILLDGPSGKLQGAFRAKRNNPGVLDCHAGGAPARKDHEAAGD